MCAVLVAAELHRGHVAGIILTLAVSVAFLCFVGGYYFFVRRGEKRKGDRAGRRPSKT